VVHLPRAHGAYALFVYSPPAPLRGVLTMKEHMAITIDVNVAGIRTWLISPDEKVECVLVLVGNGTKVIKAVLGIYLLSVDDVDHLVFGRSIRGCYMFVVTALENSKALIIAVVDVWKRGHCRRSCPVNANKDVSRSNCNSASIEPIDKPVDCTLVDQGRGEEALNLKADGCEDYLVSNPRLDCVTASKTRNVKLLRCPCINRGRRKASSTARECNVGKENVFSLFSGIFEPSDPFCHTPRTCATVATPSTPRGHATPSISTCSHICKLSITCGGTVLTCLV